MSLTPPIALTLYLAHMLVVPLLLVGMIRTLRARLQGRQGPPLLQSFHDVVKLLRKGETVSETAAWTFRAAPVVSLAAITAVALMVPWAGARSPLAGDLFLIIYLLALAKFAAALAALDPGTTFGALGASREAALSVQAEPAMALALAALAVHARSSSLAVLLAPAQSGADLRVVVPLAVAALWLAMMAELARMPIDDPTTHLELTMVHEALFLENSGRNLALVEYAAALKMAVLFGVLARVLLVAAPSLGAAAVYAASIGLLFTAGVVVAVSEAVMVKLQWRRVPNLLSFALAAAGLACLVVAMKG